MLLGHASIEVTADIYLHSVDAQVAGHGPKRREGAGHQEVIGAEAGMHLVALLPRGTNDVAVSRKAAQRGISAMPLSICYLTPPTRGGLILGYGGANLHQIHDGIRKLRMSVQGH